MLVLSRKSGESIVLGDGITIRVSEIRGNRVKLCIDAPPDVRVLRSEVLAQMTQSEQAVERSESLPARTVMAK